MKKRGSGILLHITSLPSSYGIGDLGPQAYRFVDFLAEAKQSYWQILPLNATNSNFDPSPFHCTSAFAGNTLLISPDFMIQKSWLDKKDVNPIPPFPEGKVCYSDVYAYKNRLFHLAYQRFKKKQSNEYEKFCSENSSWLEDFALFVTLKKHFQDRIWCDWPSAVRDRDSIAIQSLRKEFQNKIEREKFFQFVLWKQWFSLKKYCHQKGIHVIGDMPIYVDHDSPDLWSQPEIFKLDENKKPIAVAGVPPDYFSKTGQLWGNPVYRWDVLKEKGFEWWIRRIEHSLKLYDILRIDHFRGFIGYWEVPSQHKTAKNGKWVKAPAMDFFSRLKERFCPFPIIAEDLGFITPAVKKVMSHFGFPGMKVLLYAFGRNDSMHPYLPHNCEENCIAYTGTHDNNTVRGWFEKEAKPKERRRVFRYLGRRVSEREVHWELIRLVMMSVASTVIIPMQDVLGLGEKARMNRPASSKGNWEWRLLPQHLTARHAEQLSEITEVYGRV